MSQPNKTTQLDPYDIQAMLKRKGITQKDLAKRIGVSEMTLSKAIHFDIVSERVFQGVADAIGMDRRQVFAWYYSPDNKKRRVRRRKSE
jgi:lambda repressor-like predicted transcriptional regulator